MLEAFDWLRDEFDVPLIDITQPGLYDLRDKCANQKWPRFADQMMSALSSMFRQAVKRCRSTGMKINPCLGMDKSHEADPNANREWFPVQRASFGKRERRPGKHSLPRGENPIRNNGADVAELVDARDLKSLDGNVVWVRVPPPAPDFALTGCAWRSHASPRRSMSGMP